jgi:hypothetical protein
MKTKIMLVIVCLAMYQVAQAQLTASFGVFETETDYAKNKRNQTLQLTDNNLKVKVTKTCNVLVYYNSAITRFKFGDIAGYTLKGEKYRAIPRTGVFSLHGYAREVEKRGLIIYSLKTNGYKSSYTHYFYSFSDSSPVKSLTLSNLEKDFQSDPLFLQRIKQLKKSGGLTQKNSEGQFLINTYYNERPNL